MRQTWDASSSVILVAGDPLHGQIADLLANPEEDRTYPVLQDAPAVKEAVSGLPRKWETTHELLSQVGHNVITGQTDFKKWMNGAELDDDLKNKLLSDDKAFLSSMCVALDDARAYYEAAGGYPDDITFLLMSDKGDQECQTSPMARSYATKLRRRALVTVAESPNETPDTNVEGAFISDHAGFIIQADTSVRVIAHRYVDSIDSEMCRIHGGGGTGWVPCSWLSRLPSKSDG